MPRRSHHSPSPPRQTGADRPAGHIEERRTVDAQLVADRVDGQLTTQDLWRAARFTPNPRQREAILHVDGPLHLHHKRRPPAPGRPSGPPWPRHQHRWPPLRPHPALRRYCPLLLRPFRHLSRLADSSHHSVRMPHTDRPAGLAGNEACRVGAGIRIAPCAPCTERVGPRLVGHVRNPGTGSVRGVALQVVTHDVRPLPRSALQPGLS
jgi:hypothetical protein